MVRDLSEELVQDLGVRDELEVEKVAWTALIGLREISAASIGLREIPAAPIGLREIPLLNKN
jgi:hypothetical protein